MTERRDDPSDAAEDGDEPRACDRVGAQPRVRLPRGPARPAPTSWPWRSRPPAPGRHRPGPGPVLRRPGHERRRPGRQSTGVSGLLELDQRAGTARVLAGTSLDDLLREIVPQGWFVQVTPGTSHVTIGGAIANDVHGKGHHATGSFGAHVRSMVLALPDGTRRTLTPTDDARRVLGHLRRHGADRHGRRGHHRPAPHRDQPAAGRQRPGARPRHPAGPAARGRPHVPPLLGRLGRLPGPGPVAGAGGARPGRLRHRRRPARPAAGAATRWPTARRPRSRPRRCPQRPAQPARSPPSTSSGTARRPAGAATT